MVLSMVLVASSSQARFRPGYPAGVGPTGAEPPGGYELVCSDEFAGDGLPDKIR